MIIFVSNTVTSEVNGWIKKTKTIEKTFSECLLSLKGLDEYLASTILRKLEKNVLDITRVQGYDNVENTVNNFRLSLR